MSGLFEADLQIVSEIITPLRLARVLPAAAKQVFENAAAAEHFPEHFKRIMKPPSSKPTRPALECRVAVLVVGGAFLRIAQNFVSLTQLLELFFSVFVSRILVRMILNR